MLSFTSYIAPSLTWKMLGALGELSSLISPVISTPSYLRDKLEYIGVDHHLITWILDYLTNQPQYVRIHDCVSETSAIWAFHREQLWLHFSSLCTPQISPTNLLTAYCKNSDIGLCEAPRTNGANGTTTRKTKKLVVDCCRGKQLPLTPMDI